jgi:hypothetical protein
MIKEFISRLTMVKTDRVGTYDLISGRSLSYYQDCYFQLFLAESRWGYRMRIK